MGTLQSKIKEGYTKGQKPIFKKGSNKGIRPIQAAGTKILASGQKRMETILPNQHDTRSKSEVISSQKEVPQVSGGTSQSLGNSVSYPASAIGLIESRIHGASKYSTGALIESNIVISTSRNIYPSKKICISPHQIKFILDYNNDPVEYQIQKVYSLQAKDQASASLKYSNQPQPDCVILVLKNHVNVQKYGTLGIDFNKENEGVCRVLTTYGFTNRKQGLRLEQIRLPAAVSDKYIQCVNPYNFDVAGGPIVEKINSSYMIIGLQSIEAKRTQKATKKYLKFDQEIYNFTSEWLTQQQEEIDLRDKNLGKDGIKRLVNLNITNLSSINIARNNIGTQGLKYLSRCEWPNLQHFDIGGNQIKKEGIAHLVKIPMKKVVNVNLWGNSIGSQGAQLLLQGDWKFLVSINLYNNNISNQGVKKLVQADWKELQSCNLGKNNINPQAIPFFENAVWKNIVTLNIWGNSIKNEKVVLAQLKKYFAQIKYLYL